MPSLLVFSYFYIAFYCRYVNKLKKKKNENININNKLSLEF